MTGFTEAARARLAMAYEACELADRARRSVPINPQEIRPAETASSAASALAEGERILDAARRYFESVVVFARLAGATWHVVGETIGLPEHIAKERFEPAETRFRHQLHAPVQPDSTSTGTTPGEWWRSYLTREPEEAARDPDDWVLRHLDGEDDPGPTPVSGNLT